MATKTIQPGSIEKERGDAAGKSFLKTLGFDTKAIDTIIRVRDKLGMKDTKRSRPDLFSIASINVVLAIIGFDVDVSKVVDIDEKERDTFIEYQKSCRFVVRRLNGIVLEGPESRDPFDAAASLRKIAVNRCPNISLDEIISSVINKGKSGTECKYCGKKKEPLNISWYCDETCKKLATWGYAFQLKNLERLTEQDYKYLITEPLSSFNEKFHRQVSIKEFVAEIKDILETYPAIGKDSLFFYAYYIAARKNSATYITYHDMMSGASDEVKSWKGIKHLMLERKSCDMENRIQSLFKKYCDVVLKQGIINVEQENKLISSFEGLKVTGMTFRTNPKTVAVALLCEMMAKMEIRFQKKNFFDTIKMSPSTVWKVSDAARFFINDPEGYRKKQQTKENDQPGNKVEMVNEAGEVKETQEPVDVDMDLERKKRVKKVKRENEAVDIDQIKAMIFGDDETEKVSKPVIRVPRKVVQKQVAVIPEPVSKVVAKPVGFNEYAMSPISASSTVETSAKTQAFLLGSVPPAQGTTPPAGGHFIGKPAAHNFPLPAKNVHAIYIDFENVYYTAKKNLGIRVNMDKLVEMLHRAVALVDDKYDSKNVMGYVYAARSLMSFHAIFDATLDALPITRGRGLTSKFEWIPTPEPQFSKKKDKKQNTDTFIVADAISAIIERSSEIQHLVLGSGDEHLAPVLKKAIEKKMFTTIIGYHNQVADVLKGLAGRVLYLD